MYFGNNNIGQDKLLAQGARFQNKKRCDLRSSNYIPHNATKSCNFIYMRIIMHRETLIAGLLAGDAD